MMKPQPSSHIEAIRIFIKFFVNLTARMIYGMGPLSQLALLLLSLSAVAYCYTEEALKDQITSLPGAENVR